MSEQQQIPKYEEETETVEQKDKKQRLKKIFGELEQKQPDILDEAAKSVIERAATFLAILFGVIALGGTFPPKFLTLHPWISFLVIGILGCYLLAIGAAMWSLQPRDYHEYLYNISRLEREWIRLIQHKKFWTRWSGLLFAGGTVALALLIGVIILPLK